MLIILVKDEMTEKMTTRVQVELPQPSMNRLKKLRDDVEATSYAEVIKNALRLYEELVAQEKAGSKIIIRSSGNSDEVIRMLF